MPKVSDISDAVPAIEIRVEGPIASIVICRPTAGGTLTNDMLDGIRNAILEVQTRGDVRVVIFRAAGNQPFGSGMNLDDLRKMNPGAAQAHFDKANECLTAIEQVSVPTIAMVRGYAFGGSCDLATACDLRIGASGARIGIPIGRFGHCPDRNSFRRLLRLISPAVIKVMIMTDAMIDAAEAHRIGFFNWVVPENTLEAFTWAVANTIAQKAPLGLRAFKQILAQVLDGSIEHAADPEIDTITSLWRTQDFQEGVAAFLERRAPIFEGR